MINFSSFRIELVWLILVKLAVQNETMHPCWRSYMDKRLGQFWEKNNERNIGTFSLCGIELGTFSLCGIEFVR